MSNLLETYLPSTAFQPTITTDKNVEVGGNFTTANITNAGALILPSGAFAGVNTDVYQYALNFVPRTSTIGTDTTPVIGTMYIGAILEPTSGTNTGISYLVGSVGGTDSVIVSIFDGVTGALVARSNPAGTLVGTAATMQRVPMTAPVNLVGPNLYFVGLQFNGTTARFRTVPIGTSSAFSETGTFGTKTTITPTTTFTANTSPVCIFY